MGSEWTLIERTTQTQDGARVRVRSLGRRLASWVVHEILIDPGSLGEYAQAGCSGPLRWRRVWRRMDEIVWRNTEENELDGGLYGPIFRT